MRTWQSFASAYKAGDSCVRYLYFFETIEYLWIMKWLTYYLIEALVQNGPVTTTKCCIALPNAAISTLSTLHAHFMNVLARVRVQLALDHPLNRKMPRKHRFLWIRFPSIYGQSNCFRFDVLVFSSLERVKLKKYIKDALIQPIKILCSTLKFLDCHIKCFYISTHPGQLWNFHFFQML